MSTRLEIIETEGLKLRQTSKNPHGSSILRVPGFPDSVTSDMPGSGMSNGTYMSPVAAAAAGIGGVNPGRQSVGARGGG